MQCLGTVFQSNSLSRVIKNSGIQVVSLQQQRTGIRDSAFTELVPAKLFRILDIMALANSLRRLTKTALVDKFIAEKV